MIEEIKIWDFVDIYDRMESRRRQTSTGWQMPHAVPESLVKDWERGQPNGLYMFLGRNKFCLNRFLKSYQEQRGGNKNAKES